MLPCTNKHILLSVFALVFFSFSSSSQDRRSFPEQNRIGLSIQEFPSVCPYGDTTTSAGRLQWGVALKVKKHNIGHVKYLHLYAQPYWDRSLSWITPGKSNNLIVDYFDTALKTLEYNCQVFQSVLDNNPTGNDLLAFQQSVYNTMKTYDLSCNHGTDSLAVLRYKTDLSEKTWLPIPEEIPDPCMLSENVKSTSWLGAGGHWGYIQESWPNNWLFQNPIHEACFTMSLRKNKACLDLGYNFSLWNHLAEGTTVCDSRLDYKWTTDKANFFGVACLDLGYIIFDNVYFTIRPYFGVGMGRLSQDSGLKGGISEENSVSSLRGFRSQSGFKVDYKFWRQLTSIPNEVYNSRYFETKLSFKVFLARSCFKEIGAFWSFNFGLLFDITVWDI